MRKEPTASAPAGKGLAAHASDKSKRKSDAESTLDEMAGNPVGDWRIADFEKVAAKIDLRFSKPSRGSHYKASSPHLEGILTIPAKKPVKAVYVKQFVSLCRAHIAAVKKAHMK